MSAIKTKKKLIDLLYQIEPYDIEELNQKNDAIHWIESGEEIYRIAKPAKPPKHLVVYFVLHDPKLKKILLFNHLSSGLLLPSGGHADAGELPFETAIREMKEELNINGNRSLNGKAPFFLSQVDTSGKDPHRDVDLWYVYDIDSTSSIDDSTEDFKREYDGYHWMTYSSILATPITKLDAHMHRFVNKLHKKSTE